MAGIYSLDYRFAILTREATPPIAEIHNRMPVIIPENLTKEWLEGSNDVLQKAITDLIFTPIDIPAAPISNDDEQPIQMSLF